MQNEAEVFPLSLDEKEPFAVELAARSWDTPKPGIEELGWGSSVWTRQSSAVETASVCIPWAVSTATTASATEWDSIDDAPRWGTASSDAPHPVWPSSASWDTPVTESSEWAPVTPEAATIATEEIPETPETEFASWTEPSEPTESTHSTEPTESTHPTEPTESTQSIVAPPSDILDAGIPFHQLAASHAALVSAVASSMPLSPATAPTPSAVAAFNAPTVHASEDADHADALAVATRDDVAADPLVIAAPPGIPPPTAAKAGRFAKMRAERAKLSSPEMEDTEALNTEALNTEAVNTDAVAIEPDTDVSSDKWTDGLTSAIILAQRDQRLALAAEGVTKKNEAEGAPRSGAKHAKKRAPKAAKIRNTPSRFFAQKSDDEVLLDEAQSAGASNVLRVAAAVSLAAGIGLFGYTVARGRSSTPTPPPVATTVVPTVPATPAPVVITIAAAPTVPAVPAVNAPVEFARPVAVDASGDLFATPDPASPSTTPTTAPPASTGDDLSFSSGSDFSA